MTFWGIKNEIFIEIFNFKKKFSGAFGAKGVKYISKFVKIVFCKNISNFSAEKSAKKSIFLTSTRYYWGLVPVPHFSGPGPGRFWSRSIPGTDWYFFFEELATCHFMTLCLVLVRITGIDRNHSSGSCKHRNRNHFFGSGSGIITCRNRNQNSQILEYFCTRYYDQFSIF